MCLQTTPVRPYQKWHWAGDEIIPSIIPAARQVPGRKKRRYPIDIREYLSIKGNAVVRRELHALIESLPAADHDRFLLDRPGHFDFRADQVLRRVARLQYIPVGRGFDHWLFPDETLANGGGDCEDLAFLLAAMLNAAGISSYCVRVALGRVVLQEGPKSRSFDHAWVMYQNEGGAWEILEPMALVAGESGGAAAATVCGKSQTVEYIPCFVFNSDHLWNVRHQQAHQGPLTSYLDTRQFWTEFVPTFAASVHESIFDAALDDLLTADEIGAIKRTSLWVDVNVLNYDPRDHFDFAYMDESWQKVHERLATGDLNDFGLAVHAIGDFYAHSLYGEFGKVANGDLAVYAPGETELATEPVYDFKNCELPGCHLGRKQAAQHWKGRIISGQWWRWYSTFPNDLQGTADFKTYRRCLPDHNLLAVDSAQYPGAPHRYAPGAYSRQFGLRQKAAVQHVRQAGQSWKAARDSGGH